MDNIKLSISQLHTLNNCEQKFVFDYIIKMDKGVKSDALLFGSAYDKLVTHLYTGAECLMKIRYKGIDFEYLKQCLKAYQDFARSTLLKEPNLNLQAEKITLIPFMYKGEFYNIEVKTIPDIIVNDLIIDNKTTGSTPTAITEQNLEQLITYAWAFDIKKVRIDYLVKLKTPKIKPLDYVVTDLDIEKIKQKFIDGAIRKLELINGAENTYNNQHQYCWTSACPHWSSCEIINDIKIRVPKSGVRL